MENDMKIGKPDAVDITRIKSSVGLDALTELKSAKGYGKKKTDKGEMYTSPNDIPYPYNRQLKGVAKAIIERLPQKKCPAPSDVADVNMPGLDPAGLLRKVLAVGRDGIIDEYFNLRAMDIRQPTNACGANFAKNRYADVPTIDSTRVILNVNNKNEGDYINANYVDGFYHHKAYICTQGPLEHTIEDFWRMVWQQNCRVLVMLTKLVERGRLKCEKYWPLEPRESLVYGNIHIVNAGIAPRNDYQITLLELKNVSTNEVRQIKHFLFLQWPDYGVPDSAGGFIRFLLHIRKSQLERTQEMSDWIGHPRGPPIVVHCSAGIGRTGTFIAVDIMLYCLEATGRVDIEATVQAIRRQRALSVQMPDQYCFCYLAILDYAVKMSKIVADVRNLGLLDDSEDIL